VPVTLARQAVRFAAIGIASTLAYLALFIVLRNSMGAQAANLTALLITAVANTAANRRLTFGVRGPGRRARSQLEGLVVFAIGLGLTSGSLALVHTFSADPHRALEVGVLIGANLLATVVRFVLLRAWVFHPRRNAQTAQTAPATPTTPTAIELSADGASGA
jgi:putative flippase GtrA